MTHATSINAKVQYVKAQPRSTHHTCHWPGCDQIVPPAMWGCYKHWIALPRHLRVRIWQTYRPGQEITKDPSTAYLAAASDVQRWIREKMERERDA